MTHRVLVLLTLSASVALSSLALAGTSRKDPGSTVIQPSAAEPLCGGSGTKNPPDGPQPPKEPPKT
jgi:hypothetical protein